MTTLAFNELIKLWEVELVAGEEVVSDVGKVERAESYGGGWTL